MDCLVDFQNRIYLHTLYSGSLTCDVWKKKNYSHDEHFKRGVTLFLVCIPKKTKKISVFGPQKTVL